MSLNSPLVSVVLPYYNAEKTLSDAITSVLNQTFDNFELILVNNNSKDGSLTIANNFAKRDSRVILLSEQKQGVAHAANLGNSLARGQFIARMDADDISLPNRLTAQVAHLQNNSKLEVSATQVKYINQNPSSTSFHHFVNWSNSIITQSQIRKNKFVEFPLVNPSIMVRSEIFKKIGLFEDGYFPEDYQWFLKAEEAECIIEKIPEILLEWKDSSDRLTRIDNKYSTEAFFKIKTHFLAKEIKKLNPQNTNVWIWGAGKLGYARSQWLLGHGVRISGYIDIKEKKLEQYPCINFSEISIQKTPFIISYITNRNKRNEVRDYLNSKGFEESKNYIIAG